MHLSYHIINGVLSDISSSPVKTFKAICHEYNVRELIILMKTTLNQIWPKNKKKTLAISIFTEKYIQHLVRGRPTSVTDALPIPVAPPTKDFSVYPSSMFSFVFNVSVLTQLS